jgi:hypothetical protein
MRFDEAEQDQGIQTITINDVVLFISSYQGHNHEFTRLDRVRIIGK